MTVLWSIEDVNKIYVGKGGDKQVLFDLTFNIHEGEVLGVVGESGSGKSTLGKLLAKIEPYQTGEIRYKNTELQQMKKRDVQAFRQQVQMIFQDPDSSLNPRMKVKDIILEGVEGFRIKLAESKEELVHRLLGEVGLSSAFSERYPFELSGGQKQRVGIARALAVDPQFIIADEPISALDVSIQAQVLNDLRRLQKERNLTMLFIGHDLNIIRYISDRIVVMYDGQIVEIASAEQLFEHPTHAYTKRLMAASPVQHPSLRSEDIQIELSRPTYSKITHYEEIAAGHFVAQH